MYLEIVVMIQKNGQDLIYVKFAETGTIGFYYFPQSRYVFTNKDDTKRSIDKSNKPVTVTSATSYIIKAFSSLPNAAKPSKTLKKEFEKEKDYHNSVDQNLADSINDQVATQSAAQADLNKLKNTLREEQILARENGYMIPDHMFISHQLNSEEAKIKIESSHNEMIKLGIIKRKPYFARIDCGKNIRELHTAYIGDQDIPGFVIDWRHAEVGNVYYHSDVFQNSNDIFLALKRIININNSVFNGFDDEINLYNGDGQKQGEISYTQGNDELLTKLLVESRADKSTHDIIKTIQSDQYAIITSAFDKNIIVNGCAGSGKTMIMYHRLSYMAYNYESVMRRKFEPSNVYLVSPSRFFDDNNNELIKKLSLDRVQQAPIEDQIEKLIEAYCKKYDIIDFHGITSLLNIKLSTNDCFYAYDEFDAFWYKQNAFDNKIDDKSEYQIWILSVLNKCLNAYGFAEINHKDIPKTVSEISAMFDSETYYRNECFKKRQQTTDSYLQKYYSPSAINSISFENVIVALNNGEKTSLSYKQRLRRIKKYQGLLKACLATDTKVDSRSNIFINISEFWNLLDNQKAYERMLILIFAEKLLKILVSQKNDMSDLVMKCQFIHQKYFEYIGEKNFSLFILRLFNYTFGKIISDDSLIFIDEFQNYSDFEIDCLRGSFEKPVFNLFGDYDQCIESKGVELQYTISDMLKAESYNINVNYRNAKQITEYINKQVYKNMQPVGINGDVAEVKFSDCTFGVKDRTAVICKDVKLISKLLKQSVSAELINNVSSSGVIQNSQISLMTVADCKGLEFDTVYVFDFGMSDNEKYVAYTRALDSLFVIKDNPEELKKQKDTLTVANEQEAEKEQTAEMQIFTALLNEIILKKTKVAENSESKLETSDSMVENVSDAVYGYQNVDVTEESDNLANDEQAEPEIIDKEKYLSEDIQSVREKELEEKLNKLVDYYSEIERRNSAERQNEITHKENIYMLATSKMYSDDMSQLQECVILFETIMDYKDSIELLAEVKIRLMKLEEKINCEKQYISENRCRYCGGKFKGVFSKRCRDCGQKKDY